MRFYVRFVGAGIAEMQNIKERREAIAGELQYCGIYGIIYLNSYKEPRIQIVSANNTRDCEDIAQSRGLKILACFEFSDIISKYRKDKNKHKNKEKN